MLSGINHSPLPRQHLSEYSVCTVSLSGWWEQTLLLALPWGGFPMTTDFLHMRVLSVSEKPRKMTLCRSLESVQVSATQHTVLQPLATWVSPSSQLPLSSSQSTGLLVGFPSLPRVWKLSEGSR